MAPCDPGNIVDRPTMLKYAAVMDILSADKSVNIESVTLYITLCFEKNQRPIEPCRLYNGLLQIYVHT